MQIIISTIDRLADLLASLGKLTIFCLIMAMLYEVFARYILDSPTLWAFDISYMLNGSIFLLGGAYALKVDAHVRIDFISLKFPKRFQQLFNGILYLIILAPIFGIFSYVSSKKAIEAFIVGEVESVSPWAPLVWPFYSIIAIGLIAVTLQFISESLKLLAGQTMPGQSDNDDPEKDTSA